MSQVDDVKKRRQIEAKHIKQRLSEVYEISAEEIPEGEEVVAFVNVDQCIGCDQCMIVCDDDAIEVYDAPLKNSLLHVEMNKKAKILRDPCTGCRLCVLACPTDAIIIIDR